MRQEDVARLLSSLVSESAREETSIAKLVSDPSTAWDFVASVLQLPKDNLLQLIEYKEDYRANNARTQGGHWQLNRKVHALLKKSNPPYEHQYGQVCATLDHILIPLGIQRADEVAAQNDIADAEQANLGGTHEHRKMILAVNRTTVGHIHHSHTERLTPEGQAPSTLQNNAAVTSEGQGLNTDVLAFESDHAVMKYIYEFNSWYAQTFLSNGGQSGVI